MSSLFTRNKQNPDSEPLEVEEPFGFEFETSETSKNVPGLFPAASHPPGFSKKMPPAFQRETNNTELLDQNTPFAELDVDQEREKEEEISPISEEDSTKNNQHKTTMPEVKNNPNTFFNKSSATPDENCNYLPEITISEKDSNDMREVYTKIHAKLGEARFQKASNAESNLDGKTQEYMELLKTLDTMLESKIPFACTAAIQLEEDINKKIIQGLYESDDIPYYFARAASLVNTGKLLQHVKKTIQAIQP